MKTKWHLAWAVFNGDSPYLCSIQKTRAKSIRAFVEDAKRGKKVRTDKPWSWWYRKSGLRCRRMSIAMRV
jgi:hypothetical protein